MNRLPNLFLASQSPRRAQLLETLGLPFKVLVSDTDEVTPIWENIETVTLENAREKARVVLAKIKEEDAIVIGADTLVLLDREVMCKPRDQEDAKKILQKLSGQKQTVVTGLCLQSKKYGNREVVVKS